MNDVTNAILLVYAGLFPTVNPIASAPIFLGMTRLSSDSARNALAFRVALNGFWLLLGALFVGSHLLEFFGITLPIVRISGGLVVTAFGWRLLHEGAVSQPQAAGGAGTQPAAATDSFYPLTMPLTVGPGSIAVAITLGSQRPIGVRDLEHLALLGGGAVAGLLAIAVTIFICYRFATRTVTALGEGGTNVLVRLSAFILLCIGIQIVWNGYTSLTNGG